MARKLILEVVAEAAGAERTLRSIDQHSEKIGHSLGGIGKAALLGGAGFVAFEGAKETLVKAFEAGESLRKSQESLDAAIKHTGGNVEVLRGKYDEIAKSAANYGITEDQANQGLAKATVLTGDSEKAMRAYQEAVQIAAATHRSLQSVLVATSKAQDGNTGALSRYGVQLDKNASSLVQFHAIMDRFGGQAAANTSQVDILKAHLSDWQQELGAKLVPAVNNAIAFISQHWPQIQTVMEAVFRGVQVAWETVLQPVLSNLILWGERVVAFIRDHWPEISATAREVFNTVKKIVDDVTTVVEALWREFGGTLKKIATNDLAAVEDAFRGLWTTIKGVVNLIDDLIHGRWSQIFGDLKQIVSGAVDTALAVLTGAVKNFAAIGEKMGAMLKDGLVAALSGLGAAVSAAIRGAINLVIDAIDSIHIHIPSISILGHKIGGGDIGFDIPHLAQGGIVTGPTLALIGERGPEAVVPLSGGGMGGNHFYFPNYVGDKRELVDAIKHQLRREVMRGGTLPGLT